MTIMMKDFSQEYYFLLKRNDDKDPVLGGDEDTKRRNYDFEQMPVGSAPLIFRNAFLELDKAQGTKLYNILPDVLFCGADLIVKANIREILFKLNLPNIALNESIYIDHNEVWHENLWYIAPTQEFDCWDRQKSTVSGGYDPEDEELGTFRVKRYVLNHALLDKTPLQERLLFRIGKTSSGKIVAHASVAKYFHHLSGVLVLPVSEFGAPDKLMTYI